MAKKVWEGGAVAIADVWTITIANTWATSDTITLTVNGNDMILTVGSSTGTTDVAAALSAAINAVDATAGLVGDESRNIGGQQIVELREIEATVASSVVTITHKVPGVPITISVTETTAGDGTATESNATTATGPYHFDNADNWVGGSLPANGDELIYDHRARWDCRYGLTYLEDNTLDTFFTRTTDCTIMIGLPDENERGYKEYRERRLVIYDTNTEIQFLPGYLTRQGGVTRLDCEGATFDVLRIVDAGTVPGPDGNKTVYNAEIYGGTVNAPSEVHIGRGATFLGLENASSDTVTIGSSTSTTRDTVCVIQNPIDDPSLLTANYVINGGQVDLHSPPLGLANISTASNTITIRGGVVNNYGQGEWGPTTIQSGGKLVHRSVGYYSGAVNVYTGGELDLAESPLVYVGNGIATLNLYGGAKIRRFNQNVNLPTPSYVGCTPADVVIEGFID